MIFLAFIAGFYLGGAFYVGMLAAAGYGCTGDPLTFDEALITAAIWPVALYQLVKER